MPAATSDKNDLFAQYQILEDLGDFPNFSLFKVKAPNGSIKLWKKIDLQFSAATIETRLLPVIEKVHHPYLNAVSGSFLFPDKGLLFVESDFPVKTLRHRLDECRAQGGSGGIPVNELFGYIAQAADAIDYLNAAQHVHQGKKIAIYHRALSPDSLHLFEEKGKIVCKVGDFGLAKPVTDAQEAARHSLGLTNYDYAPPEYDEGLTTNTSDQYALATTYYELRTGQLPFRGSLLQKLQAQLSGNPDLSLVDAAERPAIARALSREPQARFRSCREFMQQIQAALGGVVTMPIATQRLMNGKAPEPAASASSGGALFGGGSGWSSKPVDRSGGSLFNISSKSGAPTKTPLNPEGWNLINSAVPTKPTSQSGAPPRKQEPAPIKPLGASPKAAEQQLSTFRIPTPKQAEGWSLEEPKSEPKSKPKAKKKPDSVPPPLDDWTPGDVAVAHGSSTGASSFRKTPGSALPVPPPVPTPEPKQEALSSKARETLELIRRRQAHSSIHPPPPTGIEKPITSGSKYAGDLPAKPQAATPFLGHAAAGQPEIVHPGMPPHPFNPLPLRKPSSPAHGLPHPKSAGEGMHNLPRRTDSTGKHKPVEPLLQPLRLAANEKAPAPSWISMLMLGIAAFCVGLLLITYFTRK